MLLELGLALTAVLRDAGPSIWGFLPLELKRRGEFADLDVGGLASLSLDDIGLSLPEFLDWYQAAHGSIEGSLHAYAKELGFESPREPVTEILLHYSISANGRPPRGATAG